MRTHLNKKLAKALSLSPYEGERADNPEYASTFGKRLNIGKTVCVVSILFQPVAFVTAQAQSGASDEIESIFVLGERRAYQGNFDDFETPQAQLRIDEETLRNAGVVDLVQALVLSASASRQNNFGGLGIALRFADLLEMKIYQAIF